MHYAHIKMFYYTFIDIWTRTMAIQNPVIVSSTRLKLALLNWCEIELNHWTKVSLMQLFTLFTGKFVIEVQLSFCFTEQNMLPILVKNPFSYNRKSIENLKRKYSNNFWFGVTESNRIVSYRIKMVYRLSAF